MLAAAAAAITLLGAAQNAPISPSTGGHWDPVLPLNGSGLCLETTKAWLEARGAGACDAACWGCRTTVVVRSLMARRQDPSTGLFGSGAVPWVDANAIETIADFAARMGGLQAPELAGVRDDITLMLEKGFNSSDGGECHTPACGSYDDQGWWGLAWAKAYELTGDPRFLLRSAAIFDYLVQHSWDEKVCGGGCWWSSAAVYKNSVTNQLFFTLSARLQIHAAVLVRLGAVPTNTYLLGWARKAWAWLSTGGGAPLLNKAVGLYSDGLTKDGRCRSNGDPADPFDGDVGAIWSYNQGVVMSGLAALGALTNDSALLTNADNLFVSVVAHMTSPELEHGGGGGGGGGVNSSSSSGAAHVLVERSCNGSKVEHRGTGCDENQVMFKGAFMRHLGYLHRAPFGLNVAQKQQYIRFADENADWVWWHARLETTTFGRGGGTNAAAAEAMAARDEWIGGEWRGPFVSGGQHWFNEHKTMLQAQVSALGLFASLAGKAAPGDGGSRHIE